MSGIRRATRLAQDSAGTQQDGGPPWLPGQLPLRAVAALNRLVDSPFEYPSWSPRNGVWEEDDLRRVNSLRIPVTSVENGDPDSVLYGLGRLQELDPEFPVRLESFIADKNHIMLVNSSGSGKTKLVLEALYRHWGLFFTASWHPVVNPHGSDDLAIVLRTFDAHHPCRRVPLAKKAGEEPAPELAQNRDLLSQQMELLVLARLQLLDHFCDLASSAGLTDDDARMRWFWLQIRPLDIAAMNISAAFIQALRSLDRVEIKRRLRLLADSHKDRLRFVAIDEAQILDQLHTRSFSSRDLRRHRPILREILVCLGSLLPHSRLIACGTEIDEDAFEDAVSSSESTIRAYRGFCRLGRFWDIEDIRRYLTHFLGDISQENVALAHRYFRGRRRFLAVLVQRTLVHGIPQYLYVFDAILFATTGLRRPGSAHGRRINIMLGPVTVDDLLDESPMAAELRCTAYCNITQHGSPIFSDNMARNLVGLAVAHFVDEDMNEAHIDEPVILLNLARWLRSSRRYATERLIKRRMRDSTADLRGSGFADSIALFLWRRFAMSGLRLVDLVAFPGAAPPRAAQSALFALTFMDGDTRKAQPIKRLKGPLVHAAIDSADTLAWFQRSRAPFLIPDSRFGPQLVFVLHMRDGPLLVFVHLEPSLTGRRSRQKQVTPTHPSQYYASDRAARQDFSNVLATFPAPTQSAKARAGPTVNSLQVYAFADVQRRKEDAHLPPAATLRLDVVLDRDGSVSDGDATDDEDVEKSEDAMATKHHQRWFELQADDIGQPIE